MVGIEGGSLQEANTQTRYNSRPASNVNKNFDKFEELFVSMDVFRDI